MIVTSPALLSVAASVIVIDSIPLTSESIAAVVASPVPSVPSSLTI